MKASTQERVPSGGDRRGLIRDNTYACVCINIYIYRAHHTRILCKQHFMLDAIHCLTALIMNLLILIVTP